MSASPANPPSGPSSATPSATTQAPMRRKPPVSIFAPKKKPAKKPAPGKAPATSTQPNNGATTGQRQANGVTAQSTNPQDDPSTYSEYPIIVSRSVFEQALQYHAMRLKHHEGAIVNPYDATQFQRPVRLHRRMARDKRELGAEQSDAASGVEDKEREALSIRRAERQAEREANQALIAPTGGETKKSGASRKKPQKKVEDVYFDVNNAKHVQKAQLRYEEARPWHLEDFEGKNVWVGSYEEPLSNRSVMFEIGADGFRMVPIKKWYTFQQTNRFEVMDSEAVEKHMGQKFKAPRWFLGTQTANDEARRQEMMIARQKIKQARGSDDDDDVKPIKREAYQADVDEIDFEFNDEFQDDDEGMIFGDQDEDAKDIEKRIREEMRDANIAGSGLKDVDKDYDAEEEAERKKEREAKRKAKRMRKQLIKKERKNEYDSDSDRNEFSESEESEDSEEERERLEEERKQEEARKANGDKSGASSKGTNTPSGRSEKRDQGRLGMSLKRPGSPDLSEMSGNESSRKKVKGVNGRAVSSAPNGARSLSPDTARPRASGYGSGSDTDTSRRGTQRIKLKNSPTSSPTERSRAASPVAGASTNAPANPNSRPQSPQRTPLAEPLPTLEDVRAAIPAEGIELKDMVKAFKSRFPPSMQRTFIDMVKMAGKQDPVTKRIVRKD